VPCTKPRLLGGCQVSLGARPHPPQLTCQAGQEGYCCRHVLATCTSAPAAATAAAAAAAVETLDLAFEDTVVLSPCPARLNSVPAAAASGGTACMAGQICSCHPSPRMYFTNIRCSRRAPASASRTRGCGSAVLPRSAPAAPAVAPPAQVAGTAAAPGPCRHPRHVTNQLQHNTDLQICMLGAIIPCPADQRSPSRYQAHAAVLTGMQAASDQQGFWCTE